MAAEGNKIQTPLVHKSHLISSHLSISHIFIITMMHPKEIIEYNKIQYEYEFQQNAIHKNKIKSAESQSNETPGNLPKEETETDATLESR